MHQPPEKKALSEAELYAVLSKMPADSEGLNAAMALTESQALIRTEDKLEFDAWVAEMHAIGTESALAAVNVALGIPEKFSTIESDETGSAQILSPTAKPQMPSGPSFENLITGSNPIISEPTVKHQRRQPNVLIGPDLGLNGSGFAQFLPISLTFGAIFLLLAAVTAPGLLDLAAGLGLGCLLGLVVSAMAQRGSWSGPGLLVAAALGVGLARVVLAALLAAMISLAVSLFMMANDGALLLNLAPSFGPGVDSSALQGLVVIAVLAPLAWLFAAARNGRPAQIFTTVLSSAILLSALIFSVVSPLLGAGLAEIDLLLSSAAIFWSGLGFVTVLALGLFSSGQQSRRQLLSKLGFGGGVILLSGVVGTGLGASALALFASGAGELAIWFAASALLLLALIQIFGTTINWSGLVQARATWPVIGLILIALLSVFLPAQASSFSVFLGLGALLSAFAGLSAADARLRRFDFHQESLLRSYGFYGSFSTSGALVLLTSAALGALLIVDESTGTGGYLAGLTSPEVQAWLATGLAVFLAAASGLVFGLLRVWAIRRQEVEQAAVVSRGSSVEKLLGI